MGDTEGAMDQYGSETDTDTEAEAEEHEGLLPNGGRRGAKPERGERYNERWTGSCRVIIIIIIQSV